MKKLFSLIAVLCSGMGYLSAQYFDYQYGSTPGSDYCTHGLNLRNGTGQIQVGLSLDPTLFTVFVSDLNGNITPGSAYFGNEYRFSDPVTGLVPMLNESTKIVELSNGTGYIVSGSFDNGQQHGVFYAALDANGFPLSSDARYFFLPALPNGDFSGYRVWGILESAVVPGDVLILGEAAHPQYGRLGFVIRNTPGASCSSASVVYRLSSGSIDFYPRGFVENPVLGEIAITGYVDALNGSGSDGFLLRVDATTLLPLGPMDVLGNPGSYEYLNGIRYSNNPMASNGYVLSGETGMYGNSDFWQTLVAPGISQVWSWAYDYSFVPGGYNTGLDIYERYNANAGQYEYYQVGYADPGIFGDVDVQVIKTDMNGNGLGEFTYGTSDVDIGVSIDGLNTGAAGPPDGLSVFAFRQSPGAFNRWLELYRTYFNGVTACNYITNSPSQLAGPASLSQLNVLTLSSFVQAPIGISSNAAIFYGGCFVNSDPSGTNMKTISDKKKDAGLYGIRLASNLISMKDGQEIQLQVDNKTGTAGNLTLKVLDAAGKEYYATTTQVKPGNNDIPFSLSNKITNSGIYFIHVSDASGRKISTLKMMIGK